MTKKIFYLTLLIALVSTGLNAQSVTGNGNLKTIVAEISDFNKIEVSGIFDIHYTQADQVKMVLTADENILKYIKYEVKDNQLSISFEKDVNMRKFEDLSIELQSPNLKSLEVSGVVNFETLNLLKTKEMKVNVSGVANIEMDLNTTDFKGEFSGASNCEIKGKAENVKLEFSGAGNFSGADFIANSYSVEMSGVGNADIHVLTYLNVDISGAGSVSYRGEPEVIKKDISFLGSLSKY